MWMEAIVNIVMMIICIEVFIYGFKKGWHSKESNKVSIHGFKEGWHSIKSWGEDIKELVKGLIKGLTSKD